MMETTQLDPRTGLPVGMLPVQTARTPGGFLDRIGGLLGGGQDYGGLLSPEEQKASKQQALLAMGANLLASSGPSPTRTSFGQALGQSVLAGQQASQQSAQDQLRSLVLRKQLEKASEPEKGPASVQEYEYAKKNGYTGSFQEWTVAGGQSSRPSSVQEWEAYYKLISDDKKNGTHNAQLYLEMKRNPGFQVKDINEVPTVVAPSYVGGTETTQLSSLPAVIQAAEMRKRAEASAGARGTVEGATQGDITKKGSNAVSTIGTLDLADPLIDAATGSLAGAGRDKLAAVFGAAPDSAKAIAQLQVLQANLMTSMPRMEGPQSDRDVELYQKAAGQIGDPTVPSAIKKAAVQTIRQLQGKYVERAQQQDKPSKSSQSIDALLKKYGQ